MNTPPFLYFGHGIGTVKQDFYINVWCKNYITAEHKSEIIKLIENEKIPGVEETCHWPGDDDCRGGIAWVKKNFCLDIDDKFLEHFILDQISVDEEKYPEISAFYAFNKNFNETDEKELKLLFFNAAIDQMLININQVYPIAFVVKTRFDRKGFSDWHNSSLKKIQDVLNIFSHYFQENEPKSELIDFFYNVHPSIFLTEILDYIKLSTVKKWSSEERDHLKIILQQAKGYRDWADEYLDEAISKFKL